MSLASKLLSVSGGAGVPDKLYVDDVFQAFTRTGTGADVTVTTGIDMTKGYMLWSKGRSGATDHAIYDSARGVTLDLVSNTTAAQTSQATGLKSVSATGHTLGSLGKMNTSGATYVDWVFAKAPKFFDVVTYTGDGVANRQIPHALGIAPGMLVVKKTTANTGVSANWLTWHRSTGDGYFYLNTTNSLFAGANTVFGSPYAAPTPLVFSVGANANGAGETYVAYLFAHDTSADGIIQCGSFTAPSNSGTVTLGWEPQFILVKPNTSSQSWRLIDASRKFSLSGSHLLNASDAGAEVVDGSNGYPTATGFVFGSAFTGEHIYLAIRRPNKPPTLGTQVYNAIARTGTGAVATVTGVGFAPDLVIAKGRPTNFYPPAFYDRLRGAQRLLPSGYTNAEITTADSLSAFSMDGFSVGADSIYGDINFYDTYINHCFKRAPGVFDEVCYTGTGVAKTEAHGLGVVPELMIVKSRSGTARNWVVYAATTGIGSYQYLQTTAAAATFSGYFSGVLPTASTFHIANNTDTGNTAETYVAYLFASKLGISKVGSYTGNGTSQTVDCGFTTGSRFVLIKRTDAAGDWKVLDSVRGIISANDPHLALNTTEAEVTTDDSIDPASVGFIVNQVAATNLNVAAASYIYLSFA